MKGFLQRLVFVDLGAEVMEYDVRQQGAVNLVPPINQKVWVDKSLGRGGAETKVDIVPCPIGDSVGCYGLLVDAAFDLTVERLGCRAGDLGFERVTLYPV